MFTYNGIHYVSWSSDEYADLTIAPAAMDELAATGANWAGILVTRYQANRFATDIYQDERRTPSERALACAINELHKRGLRVMLKPHVDAADGSWRGEFDPSRPAAWFRSYGAFLSQCTRLATDMGVEALCIGTELRLLSGARYGGQWRSLINEIRSRYPGLLTYAANATDAKDEFTQVSFWGELDIIGLDAYFALSSPAVTSMAGVQGRSCSDLERGGLGEQIRNISRLAGKPVLFTEIGYKSVADSHKMPWKYDLVGPCCPEEQAMCYESFFKIWTPHSSWMQGAFWWNWPVRISPEDATDYTPRRKPAVEVLAREFLKQRDILPAGLEAQIGFTSDRKKSSAE